MPLTFAHPAAVLPGYRWHHRGFPFAALVIGSMSPDFEYFLRLEPIGHFAHTLSGVILFCLPIGLVVYGIFRTLVSPLLPACLPIYLQRRWPEVNEFAGSRIRRYSTLVGAIVLGALTHIGWDAFTHQAGAVVVHLPALSTVVLGLPVYKVLQHGSTVLGFALIARWIHALPVHDNGVPSLNPNRMYIAFVVAFLGCFAVLAGISPPVTMGRLVVEAIDAVLLAVLVTCMWQRCRIAGAQPTP
ncbi:MAG: DUF4184 family protein [Candidatus Hydrogenedentes bacterium]|nr:DUF4184 family protein [Candidatus Hydrogenedentota bacterium]